jgi:Fur family ferric uptake transcriptional regulator
MNSTHLTTSRQAATRPVAGSSTAQAEACLRDASVRITPARVKVLAALLGAHRAFSHQDVQETFTDMDRVTLYRALDCLIDAGLAHKIAGDDRVFRYSAGNEHGAPEAPQPAGSRTQAPTQHQHGHFKCTRCAKVFCLSSDGEAGLLSDLLSASATPQSTVREQLQKALQENLGLGFQSHDIELTIKGWCADCAR